MSFLELAISFIAPHPCLGCGLEGSLLCDRCSRALPAVASRCYLCSQTTSSFRTCPACAGGTPLNQVWVVTPYESVAKQLIHKLKFERAKAAANDVAQSIARVLPQNRPWLVVPVPTATSRVRRRGYDQAQLIAKCLAREAGCAYAPLLARSGQSRQVGHGRADRQHHLRTAFRVRYPLPQENHEILLIDDVLTTGSTLTAAAGVLTAVGAPSISAAVFAVAEQRPLKQDP